jgi:hypothetical protein
VFHPPLKHHSFRTCFSHSLLAGHLGLHPLDRSAAHTALSAIARMPFPPARSDALPSWTEMRWPRIPAPRSQPPSLAGCQTTRAPSCSRGAPLIARLAGSCVRAARSAGSAGLSSRYLRHREHDAARNRPRRPPWGDRHRGDRGRARGPDGCGGRGGGRVPRRRAGPHAEPGAEVPDGRARRPEPDPQRGTGAFPGPLWHGARLAGADGAGLPAGRPGRLGKGTGGSRPSSGPAGGCSRRR